MLSSLPLPYFHLATQPYLVCVTKVFQEFHLTNYAEVAIVFNKHGPFRYYVDLDLAPQRNLLF